MDKKNLMITGTAALVSLIAVSGFASNTLAATSTTTRTKVIKTTKTEWTKKHTALTAEQKAALEAERQKKMTAMDQAIESGYDAWKKYVTDNISANAPILKKINADNFAKYKEAYEDMKQARSILSDLGVKGKGMGMGLEMGMGQLKMKTHATTTK